VNKAAPECTELGYQFHCVYRSHGRDFTSKSGGDQWRHQDLVSGGTTIDAPKARTSTRQKRRVGSGMGRGVPSPSRLGGLEERRKLPQRPLSHFLHVSSRRTLLVAKKYDSLAQTPKYNWKIANSTLKKWWQLPPLSKVVVTSHHVTYEVVPMTGVY